MSVDRRSFLAGVAGASAATATAAAGGLAPADAATPAPAKLPRPSAVLAAAETGDPNAAGSIDRWHVTAPGSDYMVDCLKRAGYDYVACMPGSTFRGIHESIVNYGGNAKPEMLSCVHEEISAAMAHGYAKMAHKPMAIIVHNTVGLQHASMAIYNAYADRVPMMILVGNIADAAKRRPGVEWFHTATDVATIVRGYVKYDTQPSSLASWGEELRKAHALSLTPPYEPVLVVIDGELQEMPRGSEPLPLPPFSPVRPAVADPAALADVARALAGAQRPVIVADRVARTGAGMAQLVALAESLQIPVADLGGRMNFPTDHHLHQTAGLRDLVADADVILGLELTDLFAIVGDVADLPDRTTRLRIKPNTTVIAISALYEQGQENWQDQQRFFAPTMAIAGDVEASLPYLIDAVNRATSGERRAQNAARSAHFAQLWTEHRKAALDQAAIAWDASPISVPRMFAETLALTGDDDFSIVGTISSGQWQHRLGKLNKPWHYNGGSGAYGVGYGLPAAVGAAVAVRDQGRYAINFQGDGDFMVAPGSLWTAAHHKLPLLTIVHNNRAWHQETMHVQRMADRRERAPQRGRIGTLIDDPAIDYAKVAEAFGVHGEGPVSDPSQLAPALARAMKVVKSGRPAVVDVVAQPR